MAMADGPMAASTEIGSWKAVGRQHNVCNRLLTPREARRGSNRESGTPATPRIVPGWLVGLLNIRMFYSSDYYHLKKN
jgi:hypothetical protein